MADKLTREQLTELVHKLMSADYHSEEEGDELIDILESNVPHPEVSNLIFYPDREMSAEEVVEQALAYKTIQLPAGMSDDGEGKL